MPSDKTMLLQPFADHFDEQSHRLFSRAGQVSDVCAETFDLSGGAVPAQLGVRNQARTKAL